MTDLLYKEDTYKIIGICMEVHNQLGKGFNEVVYSDALEIEFIDNNIKYSKEQKFNISYKGNILPHKYRADFIINDKIVLELKAIKCLTSSHVKQTLNYLAVSKLKIGLLINFGEDSLKYQRIIL
ncbi:GxxExxY protein [Polaribacter sp. KT25b]|uniref:GxxExxY protein n=1 Tax=Polaribacter sp. KT25b TaxID=1855336 RepID=UPI00087A9A42|nr:GxxExxY protein [Polaribacter sp. KT25b]SDR66510.1 GxxExxY protein [Polaribacter sp. KT25b]